MVSQQFGGLTYILVVPCVPGGGSARLFVEHPNELLLVGVDRVHHLGVGLAEGEEEGLEEGGLLEDHHPEVLELGDVPQEGEGDGEGGEGRLLEEQGDPHPATHLVA